MAFTQKCNMCHCVSGFSQGEIPWGKFPWIRQKEEKKLPFASFKS